MPRLPLAPALTLLTQVACAHHVSWEVQPRPSYSLPAESGGVSVAVVTNGRACKAIADELVRALGTRIGVAVNPGASIRLEVRNCDRGQERTMEFEVDAFDAGGFQGATTARRRYTIRGWAAADMAVISPAGSSVVLSGSANRTVHSPWTADDDLDVNRSIGLAEDLSNDVAANLANQLVPLPVALRRKVYTEAPPGSARDLHNRAVAAEQAGDLVAALGLARQAQAQEPSRAGAEYLQALQAHAVTVGQLLF